MKTKVLYVEDEPNLGKIVNDTLRMQGFDVVWETDGGLVLSHLSGFTPDICLLDIMLPNIDGYKICKHIRNRFPKMPIIFLTAKINTEDLIKGFEAGGTDYMRKPFSIEELIARIKNQIYIHSLGSNENTNKIAIDEIHIGKYKYYPHRYELHAPNKIIKLSNREGELLQIMAGKGSQIIERKHLLMKIWGDDSFFNSRNLDVYIKKLRNYFKEDPNIEIQTLRGKGYLFLVKR
ncbi:response regulator transcription factor [Plebeiibacterium marinum]|uniref:Response regulator transcription factor n=1 Tax=Plebeiibacterium marinum TaxID=2992111 RepID=A0AAE3MHA1_9BACT|nr:response regulator transcription factor [Plebeiobacterium marinum]MCW3807569.1 response regulator transcription factor [Plebeiobacterium marinum]